MRRQLTSNLPQAKMKGKQSVVFLKETFLFLQNTKLRNLHANYNFCAVV